LFGALERLDEEGEGLQSCRDFRRTIDDFADADNDGDAVFGLQGGCHFFLVFAFPYSFQSSFRGDANGSGLWPAR